MFSGLVNQAIHMALEPKIMVGLEIAISLLVIQLGFGQGTVVSDPKSGSLTSIWSITESLKFLLRSAAASYQLTTLII